MLIINYTISLKLTVVVVINISQVYLTFILIDYIRCRVLCRAVLYVVNNKCCAVLKDKKKNQSCVSFCVVTHVKSGRALVVEFL